MLLGIGVFVLFCGVLAVTGGFVQKMRVGRLGDTPFHPTGAVGSNGRGLASPKGTISTEGPTQINELLTSPITGTQCIYYSARVTVKWKEGETVITKTLNEDARSVAFALNDGSGHTVVQIDAKKGGEFDCDKPFDGKKFSRGFMAVATARPLEITPQFSIPANVTVPGAMGRQIAVPASADYFVTEHVLTPKPFFYVNGKVQDDGTIGSPNWTSLLIKDKPRQQLLEGTQSFSKKLFLGGGIASGVGAIVALVGFLLRAPAAPEATAAAVVAPVAATVAAAGLVQAGDLRLSGACENIALRGGMERVDASSDGLNVVFVDGTRLARIFVKLPVGTEGTTDVCTLGRRCEQNLQVGDNSGTFLNTARARGQLDVNRYDLATGQMDIHFQDVELPASSGGGVCVLNGNLRTSGLSS